MSSTDIILFSDQNPALGRQISEIGKYSPWIRKIHVISRDPLPAGLHTMPAKKVHTVTPADIIPQDTPAAGTWSPAAARICLHRIPDLAEQFILLYPGQHFVSSVTESDFFSGALPTDCAVLSPILPAADFRDRLLINDTEIINDRFGSFSMILKNKKLWFSVKYGRMLLRTLQFLPLRQMIGFYDPGQPVSLLRTTCQEVWDTECDVVNAMLQHESPSPTDVDERLYRCWQLAEGRFVPRKLSSLRRKLRTAAAESEN